MLEPMAVAAHAMKRIRLAATDTVAVCGLGTIGLLLTMFLKEADVQKILTIGNKEFQKQIVRKLGIPETDYCNSRQQNVYEWMLSNTDDCGVGVFFECVGKNDTYTPAIQNTAPLGKVMLVGNPFSDIGLSRDIYWKILRNQLTVTGTWNSVFLHESEDDWNYALKRLEEKKIRPEKLISHRLPLEDMSQGFHIMRDKTEDHVKIMGIL